jgi:hypothetical protein
MRRLLLALPAVAFIAAAVPAQAEEGWTPLFNGRDLSGWTPKINHHRLGANAHDTFVAEGGVLHVRYDKYPKFYDEFAHLFYKAPFSSYRLRLDYRFVGQDTPGGPPWSKRNSGVMIHSQAPETIGLDQPFPISVEVQMLNGEGAETRTTGNICTPGTRIEQNGALILQHCVKSTSRNYSGENWVHMEIEVHGARAVAATVDGVEVVRFEKPQLDPTDLRAMEVYLKRGGGDLLLDGGYIALQGEGHPIDFRNIEILKLPE